MDLRLITSDAEHDATPAVVVQEERTRVVVRLVGEIDLAARPALDAAVDVASGSAFADIVVDLGDAGFIDCSVLAALSRLHEVAAARWPGAHRRGAPQRGIGDRARRHDAAAVPRRG